MAVPARFLFDTDFAATAAAVASPVPTLSLVEHEERLGEAIAQARATGFEEGRAAAEARATGRLAEEAGRLAAAAQSILAVLDVERARIEAEALALAETVSRKLAGALLDRFPREAVLAVFDEALDCVRRAPHVVVRLSADDAGPLGGALEHIARERGFAGRLVILGEPDIAQADCRIEWADGGIVVDRAALEASVAAIVASHVSALTATGETA
jgi:flagellar assembly protein FliH